MMAKKPTALAGIFDDEPMPAEIATVEPGPVAALSDATERGVTVRRTSRTTKAGESATGQGKASRNHGSKKPVLIHIPEDMHRALRQLSVEEGGEPLTVVTERMLRQYLVARGHTKFGPAKRTA